MFAIAIFARMKRTSFLTIVWVLLILYSCDEPSEVKPLLVIGVDETVYYSDSLQWVFATDENGEHLAMAALTPGNVVTLQTSRTDVDHFDLTFVARSRHANGVSVVSAQTFKRIPVGQVQLLKRVLQNQAEFSKFDVTITNFQHDNANGAEIMFSSTYNRLYPTNEILDVNGTTWTWRHQLWGSPSRILATAIRHGEPVYLWIENAQSGETDTVDFNDFLPMQNVVHFGFKGEGAVYGFLNGDSDPFGYEMFSSSAFTDVFPSHSIVIHY